MTQSITVRIKNVYGNEMVYPACQESHLLANLTGTKTFTKYHLNTIRDLGYEIKVESQVLAA